MPWKESVAMDERLQFVRDALSDRFTMSALCARDGVSRRIGYKWLARYDAEGRRGLVDRSRAPHHCPHKIERRIAELLVTERTAHPHPTSVSTRRLRPRSTDRRPVDTWIASPPWSIRATFS